MKRGRKPTPHRLRVLRGTAGSENASVPEFEQLEGFPEPPQHLNIDGAELWRNIGPKLAAAGVLTDVDLPLLETLCANWGRFRQRIKAGLGNTAADTQALRYLFSEFGMTPASRMRINPTPTSESNRFAANGNRQKARREDNT